jgi:hypothetical protein
MSEPVHLLWTSGWDSTFRLLDLVLNHRRDVQPHYLIDRRPSLRMELVRMSVIKQAVRKRTPEAARLIRPTIIIDLVDLPENQHRGQQFRALRAKSYIGGQYEKLARLADYLDIGHLELGVHSQDKAALFLREVLVNDGGRHCLPAVLPDPNLRLFERFDFPLFGMTKLQMQELADNYGWRDIMEMTWFCNNPTPSDEPCGICNPCTYAIEDGMGRRMPLRARIRRRLRPLRPIWDLMRRCARLADRLITRLLEIVGLRSVRRDIWRDI